MVYSLLCLSPFSGTSLRSHSMSNLLDPSDAIDQLEKVESKSYGDIPPPVTPNRRASIQVDVHPISPLPEKRAEPIVDTKTSQTKSYNEPLPPPPPPPQSLRRASVDVRPISPLPDRRAESASDGKVLWVQSFSAEIL